MARTAVRGRLSWQTATVGAVVDQTPTDRTLRLDVADWPGHRAGQHVDLRLTAEDGDQAERAYSIASAPGEALAITVERLDDGEVSPYLTRGTGRGSHGSTRPDRRVLRLGAGLRRTVAAAAGGSGIVPLRAIPRYRGLNGSSVPVRLLYSVRRLEDAIYRDVAAGLAPG
jgi:ferredoxin-NADP reductase